MIKIKFKKPLSTYKFYFDFIFIKIKKNILVTIKNDKLLVMLKILYFYKLRKKSREKSLLFY